MTNKTWYCPDLQGGLWAQYNAGQDSWTARPCCLYEKTYSVSSDINDEFWAHPTIVQQRKDNLGGKPLPTECKNCAVSEANGTYSRRQSWVDRLGTDPVDNSVLELDIQADFSCNLACRICSPAYSTYWRKVDPDYKENGLRFKVRDNGIMDLISNVPMHNLRQVHFQGGEPLLSNTHLKILEQLEAVVDLSQVSLWYHSNGTQRASEKVLECWKKFKLVEIYFSIDDMGPRFEYQRWPISWSQVADNLKWFSDNIPPNVMLQVERTVGVLTAFWANEYDNWHKDNFAETKYTDTINVNYHNCFGPYSLNALTSEYKDAVLSKFASDHWVAKTIKNCSTNNAIQIRGMLQHLTKHDLARNQSWQDVYPEFLTWYKRYL